MTSLIQNTLSFGFPYDENNEEFIYYTNCYGTGTMTKFSEIDIATFFEN